MFVMMGGGGEGGVGWWLNHQSVVRAPEVRHIGMKLCKNAVSEMYLIFIKKN